MVVKIKSWEAMVEEFGMTDDKSETAINSKIYFHRRMYADIPENRLIEVESTDTDIIFNYGVWCISSDCFEKIYKEI